jgi:glycosyltransferase involved in cell wall biosynthesis
MKFVFINTGTKQLNAGIIRCLGLGKKLVQLGHEVIILISGDQENIDFYGNQYDGIYFLYTTSRGRGFEQLHKTYQIALLKNIDVVHCMGAGSSIFMPALIARIFLRKRFQLIVDYEDKQILMIPPHKRRIHLLYEFLTFKFANKIVCASQVLAEEYKAKNTRTHYLPFAVTSQSERIAISTINSTCVNLGYLGNINEAFQDQIEYLISIFPVIKSHFGALNIHIAGTGSLHDFYVRKVKALGLEGEIIFYGFVADKELPSFFSKIDVMFFYFPDIPMNRYRCPNKVFLCCSYGLSIVSNEIGEVGKILVDYPNASFFKGLDHQSCISAIECVRHVRQVVPQIFYDKNNWGARVNTYLDIVNR